MDTSTKFGHPPLPPTIRAIGSTDGNIMGGDVLYLSSVGLIIDSGSVFGEFFSSKEQTHLARQRLYDPFSYHHVRKMVRWSTNKRRQRTKSSMRSDNSENKAWGPWANLPVDLLTSIMWQLNIIDYFAFGGVCTSWREVATGKKKKFMECQQPLAVVKSEHAKRACFLYNVFDGTRYKTILPDLTGRHFLGLSCGFLITVGKNYRFWLVNPFTRQELNFPVLPKNLNFIVHYEVRPTLFCSTQVSGFFLIIVSRYMKSILLSRSGGGGWRRIGLADIGVYEAIVDINIFKGKIYVLTCGARIGELKLYPEPLLQMCDSNISVLDSRKISMQLVTSKEDENERLFMILFHWPQVDLVLRLITIYKLDDTSMKWVQINDLGKEALFLTHMKGSAIVNTANWGGRSNLVYLLESRINSWSIFPLNHGCRLLKCTVAPVATMEPHFWYFPHDCDSKNCVNGSIGM